MSPSVIFCKTTDRSVRGHMDIFHFFAGVNRSGPAWQEIEKTKQQKRTPKTKHTDPYDTDDRIQ